VVDPPLQIVLEPAVAEVGSADFAFTVTVTEAHEETSPHGAGSS
jgi:hypothetical protein